jgi:hypothetical protein
MVEHSAVNRRVVGSNPTRGARNFRRNVSPHRFTGPLGCSAQFPTNWRKLGGFRSSPFRAMSRADPLDDEFCQKRRLFSERLCRPPQRLTGRPAVSTLSPREAFEVRFCFSGAGRRRRDSEGQPTRRTSFSKSVRWLTAVLVGLAALIFGLLLLRLKGPEDLARAAASYFFSLWSVRGLITPSALAYSTLLDFWFMVVAAVVLFVVAWRFTASMSS